MKFSSVLLVTLLGCSQAAPARDEKPPYLILTGDSTVAVNGGWGNGLLSILRDGADGVNRAKSGATTVSFRKDRWADVLLDIEEHRGDYRPVVTIQFGHNDQKESAGISLEEFKSNLEDLADEVREAGGTPILITSLTRRTFDGDHVKQNLEEQRQQAIAAAKAVGAKWLDLNLASTNYINAIGEANASHYDSKKGDKTHLNAAGEKVFGRMVADLLGTKRGDLRRYLAPNKALSGKIWAGEFATGDE
ncbi:SGNH-hydro domain-containing protein [Fusarium falciforme]|uniref:SGNH-hydro domain-containing protein n=1 Tax=Fusarium falciforme TaxID=195108 RepID=UPI002301F17A|nr:SGNH-hydro domain-containing protein [Fusarium falciforme]WAO93522.1 SGNH-hydro domain-containing protein [Fusarium falciforme]